MQTIQTILAAQDNDYAKVIFGVVFVVIWAVSQGISILAKKSEQARRRRLQEQSQQPTPPLLGKSQQPARVTVRPSRASTVRPAPPIRKAPQVARKLKQLKRPPAPPPIPKRPTPEILAPTAAALSTGDTNAGEGTEISSTSKPTKRLPNVSAPALHTWLRPATLRQQFILTEIFQPPIALRNPDSLP